MRLIIGLGNPGKEYEQTRHNIGFMVLDHLATRHHITGAKMKFHAGVLDGTIMNERCILMQPTTFMNRSGGAVREALDFYKLDPNQVLVVVDDTALPCGSIRLRASGSAGGHNGLADIECLLGTQNYPRLRVGIDAPGLIPQADYVLARFSPAQLKELPAAIDRACDAIEAWLTDDIDRAMTSYNG